LETKVLSGNLVPGGDRGMLVDSFMKKKGLFSQSVLFMPRAVGNAMGILWLYALQNAPKK